MAKKGKGKKLSGVKKPKDERAAVNEVEEAARKVQKS
jgi:hypothetical protein